MCINIQQNEFNIQEEKEENSEFLYCKTTIPLVVWQSGGLVALQLYPFIANLSQQDGYCYATDEYFVKKLGHSIATIKRGIKKLRDLGVLYSNSFQKPEKRVRHLVIHTNALNYYKAFLNRECVPTHVKEDFVNNFLKIKKEKLQSQIPKKKLSITKIKNDALSKNIKNDTSLRKIKNDTWLVSSEQTTNFMNKLATLAIEKEGLASSFKKINNNKKNKKFKNQEDWDRQKKEFIEKFDCRDESEKDLVIGCFRKGIDEELVKKSLDVYRIYEGKVLGATKPVGFLIDACIEGYIYGMWETAVETESKIRAEKEKKKIIKDGMKRVAVCCKRLERLNNRNCWELKVIAERAFRVRGFGKVGLIIYNFDGCGKSYIDEICGWLEKSMTKLEDDERNIHSNG
ncbi:helix-turn-helix domain-containing protein [Candidatus Woesearchaeota archaeon]|nr:helix-turn-helix domain-containing protein [Candidatus Woesearchaeota archaeon]